MVNMTNIISVAVEKEDLDKLNELKKGIAVNRSEFVRKMINYFYENKEMLEKL